MSKYKVLWIDDKWEDMISFKEVCELPKNGFEMICATNAEEGMEIFENHLEEWSGVILDAKVFMTSNSEVDKLNGMRYSIDRINMLKSKREVPYYIFTGQPDLKSTTSFSELYEGLVYEKDKDEDRLIADIKKNADLLPTTRIIHKYNEVFDMWPEVRHDLIRILSALENEEWQNNSLLNDIRKIMEAVMERLYECGMCTVDYKNTNLGECSKMLGEKSMEEIIPVYIQRAIHTCVKVSNDGSHRLQTNSDISNNRAPYLIRSLIYNLLDILYWAKYLPDPALKESTLLKIQQARTNYFKGYYYPHSK